MKPLGIHWFRRDLRIEDNIALYTQLRKFNGAVLGIFTFDSNFLSRSDFSHNRFQFFLHTLRELKNQLNQSGSDLLVLDMPPADAFDFLIHKLASKYDVHVSWNRDYEPFARNRDRTIEQKLAQAGWKTSTFRDHLIFEPSEILSKSNEPYKVFTPFSRTWLTAFKESHLDRIKQINGNRESFKVIAWKDILQQQLPEDQLESFILKNSPHVTVKIPEAGYASASKQLKEFSRRVHHYSSDRDRVDLEGTSDFSRFLKNGSLTTAQIIYKLELFECSENDGTFPFLRQLIWREFYYHVLWHFPFVETQSFLPQFRKIDWENDEYKFSAWKNGQTGFPIVDAAMRQLSQTGKMHNRARMIVASFLTKDLHIDWRWGEQWFMNQLLDGDLALNNGGWQWAASTGTDPQPYFRIFNPTRQSEKFDPCGGYIRTWVPELAQLSDKEIHDPKEEVRKLLGYPLPIVDHRQSAIKAELLYRNCKSN
jgi:deoxyribodipyrimidine photo-lyase